VQLSASESADGSPLFCVELELVIGGPHERVELEFEELAELELAL